MKNIDSIIEEIIKDISFRKNVDYAKSYSVKQFNMAYDRIHKNMQYVDKFYPSEISRLMELLKHADHKVVATCAPIILQLKNCTHGQKLEALTAIRNLIEDPRLDDVEKLGFSLSLITLEQNILGK